MSMGQHWAEDRPDGAQAAAPFASLGQLSEECDSQASAHQTCCVVIDTEADFLRLEGLWRSFHAEGAAPSPFASWEWVWDWWQVFGRVARDGAAASALLVVAVLTIRHELIGLIPLHHPVGPRRVGVARVLRSFGRLGKHYEAMTEEPSLLLKSGSERQAVESALWFLLHSRRRTAWDCIDFWVQHAQDSPMAAPRAACSRQQARSQHRKVLPVLELALPPSWEGLRRTLSRSMRDNLKYYPRLLSRHGHTWQVAFATDPAEIGPEADALTVLHRHREGHRVKEPYGGHLPSATHRCFLRDRLCAMAARGEAAVAVLRINGERAASQALLRRGGTTLFYYSGFSPGWAAYSPMTILQAEILAQLIAQKVVRVNLLAYDYPWKTRWGATQAEWLQQLGYVRRRPDSWARVWLYSRAEKTFRDPLEGTDTVPGLHTLPGLQEEGRHGSRPDESAPTGDEADGAHRGG